MANAIYPLPHGKDHGHKRWKLNVKQDINELAMELVQLQQNEPPQPKEWIGTLPTSRSRQEAARYWSWKNTVFQLQQELYGRIGSENGDQLINKMRQVLKLLT